MRLCPSSRTDPAAAGTVWLLATDSEWVREQVAAAARYLHAGLRVWHSAGSIHPDNRHHQQALSEMLLVGQANHLVTTRLSTFSFAMHARANKRPWVVGLHHPTCTHAAHSQDGLFTAAPVHDGWPWQPEQISRVSCASRLNRTQIDLPPPACSPLCPV
jgi:hypothetical protein